MKIFLWFVTGLVSNRENSKLRDWRLSIDIQRCKAPGFAGFVVMKRAPEETRFAIRAGQSWANWLKRGDRGDYLRVVRYSGALLKASDDIGKCFRTTREYLLTACPNDVTFLVLANTPIWNRIERHVGFGWRMEGFHSA